MSAPAATTSTSTRRAQAAAGVWLALLVVAFALALLGPRKLATPCTRWLLALAPAWAVLVAALATARLPGVDDEVERQWTRWGRDLGLLGLVTLGVVAAFTVVDLSRLAMPLRAALSLALFVSCGGCMVGGVWGAGVWGLLALAVARLPRGSTRQEAARAAHVAAPLLFVVLVVSSGLSRRSTLATDAVVVPVPIAVGLTLSGFVLILALWLRLRARPAE